jgi:ferredoxin-NADP reductase
MDHHVFNPVAAGAFALALLSDTSATWWVGTPILLPFVLLGGYLVVKKVNREKTVGQFLGCFLAIVGIASLIHSGSIANMFNTWYMSVTHTALLFFAAVMFTEPATSPGTDTKRSYFAYLTAVLYATPQLNLLGIVLTPEMALIIANAFSFAINPQYRYVLTLKVKRLIARDTYEFEFETPMKLSYIPGQYMEWTLPHPKMDNRGNRRYFSLSSMQNEAPAFAIKYYTPPSSYKANLLQMPVGATLSATSLAGDFTLPKHQDKPLVFVAGGIGIAPFRSMIKQVVETKKKVDITLIYVNKTADEVCYLPLWEEAKAYGITTHFCLTDRDNLPTPWHGLTGHLTPDMIKSVLPQWQSSTYYISGPQRLVESVEEVLQIVKIPKNQIITDFFPGY